MFTVKISNTGSCFEETWTSWLGSAIKTVLLGTNDLLFSICTWTLKKVFFVEQVLSFLKPFQILTLAEKIACYHSITRRKNCQSRKARRLHSANSSSNSGRYPHLISHTTVFIEIRKELKNSMSPFILIATAMFAQSYGFFDFWQSVYHTKGLKLSCTKARKFMRVSVRKFSIRRASSFLSLVLLVTWSLHFFLFCRLQLTMKPLLSPASDDEGRKSKNGCRTFM